MIGSPIPYLPLWMDSDVLTAFATAGLALGTCGAALWAAYTYKQSKGLEAARWQAQIFDRLFLTGKFDSIRDALDRDFDRGLARKIELSVQGYDSHLSEGDRKLLLELDNFLNLLEYLLYLEQDRGQIDANDRDALFGYWIELFKSPGYSAIRHYASHYGYERVAKLIAARNETLLLLYGSLRRGEAHFRRLGLDEALEFRGTYQFAGDLYDLGEYPGAVPGKGKVEAELYEVTDPSILAVIDDYEEFDASDPDKSLYVRRCIHVPQVGDAWVYLFNGDVSGRKLVPSGEWTKGKQKGLR